ncbi:hypothetical protein Y919_03405 [Caloranaerobacter azorensis H53214]|uniref:Uncharacterized protein n=2 Tax=Caloranaerobacter azorensis TaxID=116090 RepID=A0A096CWL9_9FIRM|nr:hypothetical protein Y919_03405 [Caloranaerobacter azorensis H53214]
MQNEMKDIKSQINGMQSEMKGMQGDIKGIRDEVRDVKVEMAGMRNKVDETYEIVKALEHRAQVNKAEHDQMRNDIAYIKGDVQTIKRAIYRIEEATASNWADIARLKQVNMERM